MFSANRGIICDMLCFDRLKRQSCLLQKKENMTGFKGPFMGRFSQVNIMKMLPTKFRSNRPNSLRDSKFHLYVGPAAPVIVVLNVIVIREMDVVFI